MALEKVGITQPIDAQLLAKGNPQAHMTLLQRIYALAPPQSPGQRGLAPLDANSLDAGSRGKRRMAPSAAFAAQHERLRSKRKLEEGDAEESGEPSAADAAAAAAEPPAPPANALELALRAQLDECRAELSLSKAEAANLQEEVAFYEQKLGLIEDACATTPAAELGDAVLGLLRADENTIGGMAIG